MLFHFIINKDDNNMNRLQRICLCIGIQVLLLLVSMSYQWDIEHIVFGEDVILTCILSVCSNSIKSWIGGSSYDLLCYNDYSTNPSKYEMISEDCDRSFGLRIKNVTFDDVNCKYTCACGLQQYTSIIDVEAINYTYPPRVFENSNFQTAEEYVVDVVIEVYPLPTSCFIQYQDRFIGVNLTSNSSTLSKFGEGRFGSNKVYKESIKHTLQKTKSNICDGILLVTCEVDSRNYTVYHQNVSMCKDNSDTNKTTISRLAVHVSVIIVSVLILIVIILSCRIRRHHKHCKTSCWNYNKKIRTISWKQKEKYSDRTDSTLL